MQEKHAPKNFRHFISIKSQYPLNMQNLKRILYLFFNHPSKIPYRFLSIGYYRVCAVQLSTCILYKVDNQQYYVLYITSISEVFRFCYSSVFSVFCFFYASFDTFTSSANFPAAFLLSIGSFARVIPA